MSQLNPVKKFICQTFEKCNECCKIIEHHGKKRKEKRTHGGYRRSAEVKHRCGGAECNVCMDSQLLHSNQGEALDEDGWDYEAMQESHGEHFPIMVCCETNEEDYTHTFYGKECS